MVKALDLRSNVRMHTWVRTPFLVWDPAQPIFFLFPGIEYLFLVVTIIIQEGKPLRLYGNTNDKVPWSFYCNLAASW